MPCAYLTEVIQATLILQRRCRTISVIFVQKLRQIPLEKLCSVRKCWTAKVLDAGMFAAKTDSRIDFRSGKAGKLGGCPQGLCIKK